MDDEPLAGPCPRVVDFLRIALGVGRASFALNGLGVLRRRNAGAGIGVFGRAGRIGVGCLG